MSWCELMHHKLVLHVERVTKTSRQVGLGWDRGTPVKLWDGRPVRQFDRGDSITNPTLT